MNYIRELNAFRDWLIMNNLTTSEVALWHSLMLINNMAGWREWFTVPNSTLQQLTKLSKQGMDNARSDLNSKGLIIYKKGNRKQCGTYKINSLVNSFDQKVDQTVDQTVDRLVDQTIDQRLPITKLNKTKLNNKDKPPIPPKVKLADFVSMTNDELEKLVAEYGTEFTERCIEELNNYKGSSGKTYKSDYHTILKWVVKRVNEEKADKTKPNIRNRGQSGKPHIPAISVTDDSKLSDDELRDAFDRGRKLEGKPTFSDKEWTEYLANGVIA